MTKSQVQDCVRGSLFDRQMWSVKYDPDFVAAKKKRELQVECTVHKQASSEDSFWGM